MNKNGSQISQKNEHQPKSRHQAPDGGWGWVVVACSFSGMLIHGGAWSMFGQFFPELLDAFNDGEAKTVGVASIQFVFQFGTGEYILLTIFYFYCCLLLLI